MGNDPLSPSRATGCPVCPGYANATAVVPSLASVSRSDRACPVTAVRLVRSGDALLAPSITRRLVERFAPDASVQPVVHSDLSSLTPRELEVLRLLARGLSNAELAAKLTLSEATVKTHVANILAKLQLRDRVQAVVLAYETGLVGPGQHGR